MKNDVLAVFFCHSSESWYDRSNLDYRRILRGRRIKPAITQKASLRTALFRVIW